MNWEIIYNTFKDLLDNKISSKLEIPLRHVNTIAIENIPSTIYHGAYTINFDGVNRYDMLVPKVVNYDIDIKIQIGYEININDFVSSNQTILKDIGIIINELINSDNYKNNLISIQLKSCNAPKLIGNTYQLWEIVYSVINKINLN